LVGVGIICRDGFYVLVQLCGGVSLVREDVCMKIMDFCCSYVLIYVFKDV